MVLARITPEGLRLLARLDRPVLEAHRKQLASRPGAIAKADGPVAGGEVA